MKKFSFLIPVLAVVFATPLRAQYDAMFTQYMFNEMFINPGYTGSREAMSATLLHRQQWLNFNGRPVTTTFSLHGPLCDNKMGIGGSFLNERLGVLSRNLGYLSYAYRIKTGKEGRLAFGLMAGLHNQNQRFSDLKASSDGAVDPSVAQANRNVTTFNFGTGVYFNTRTFYVGISIPRLIDDQLRDKNNGTLDAPMTLLPTTMHYYLTLGKAFELSENFTLKTQGMIKAVSGAPVQADLNLNALLYKSLWLGAGYRTMSAVTAFLGVQPTPQFFIGYSYDIDLNGLQQYTGGSHEVVLSYLFAFNMKKIPSPRYF
jgi:type IX secretion system PorP/SprF family membrane protein